MTLRDRGQSLPQMWYVAQSSSELLPRSGAEPEGSRNNPAAPDTSDTSDTSDVYDTPQIYDPDLVPPLVATIRVLIGAKWRHCHGSHEHRHSEAIIAATVRNPATLRLFQDTCGTSPHTSILHEPRIRKPP